MKNKTERELIDLISLGENDKMEFKISVPSKVRDLSEEICAFANSEGGLVLIGVDDDGIIKGTEISNSKRSAIQNSINGISPEIDCEYYPVTVGGKEIWVIDDKSFGGSLLSQYEKANSWIEEKLQVEYIIEGLGPRKEVWDIPLEVIREALVNALCHRDYYETGSVTMVEVFDDRVSITNPGGMLPIVQKNFGHLSKSRNPKIFELFTRMNLVEKVGSGIPRMIEAMKNAKLPEPDLNYESEHFFITFKKRELDKVPNKVPNKVLDRIVEILTENPSITNMELGEMLEISDRMVRKHLSELKSQNKIERVGAKKNGYWKILVK